MKKFVNIYYANAVFADAAESIRESLASRMSVNLTHTLDATNTNVWILFGVNELPPSTILPENYIVFQLEQISVPNNKWLTQKYLDVMRGAKQVWEYSSLNVKLLHAKGLTNVFHVPIAYSKCLTKSSSTSSSCKKDIDILFIGSINQRRKMLLEKLQAHGLTVEIRDGGLWGDERTTLLQRAKIHLNIHYHDGAGTVLEMARLSVLLANHCFIISETSSDTKLDKHIENGLIFGTYDKLYDLCLKYLSLDTKRTQIAQKGYTLFSQTTFNFPINFFTLVKSCSLTSSDGAAAAATGQVLKPIASTDRIDAIKLHTDSDGLPAIQIPELTTPEYPTVSLLTPTRNRKLFASMMLHQVEHLDYPADKLEWIVVDDSDNPDDFTFIQNTLRTILGPKLKITCCYLPPPNTISAKRNYAANLATGQYLCHIDDDDYYFEHSLKTKIAFLQHHHPHKRCIGSTKLAIYNLIDNTSIQCNTNQLPEASMTYTKSFWTEQGFAEHLEGEGYPFTMGRREQCLDLPYLFNMVAINHGTNITGKTRLFTGNSTEKLKTAATAATTAATTTNLFDIMDDETQDILSDIKKYIEKKNQPINDEEE
jgi:hypothetical protein